MKKLFGIADNTIIEKLESRITALEKSQKELSEFVEQMKKKRTTVRSTKKDKMTLIDKRQYWDATFGMIVGETLCPICGINKIHQCSFSAGHVKSEAHGGTKVIKNILPICQSCNSTMGSTDMDEYVAKHGAANMELLRKKGIVKQVTEDKTTATITLDTFVKTMKLKEMRDIIKKNEMDVRGNAREPYEVAILKLIRDTIGNKNISTSAEIDKILCRNVGN